MLSCGLRDDYLHGCLCEKRKRTEGYRFCNHDGGYGSESLRRIYGNYVVMHGKCELRRRRMSELEIEEKFNVDIKITMDSNNTE